MISEVDTDVTTDCICRYKIPPVLKVFCNFFSAAEQSRFYQINLIKLRCLLYLFNFFLWRNIHLTTFRMSSCQASYFQLTNQ